jgi:hypothetical protein
MLPVLEFILNLRIAQLCLLFLKTGIHFSNLLNFFFPLNSIIKKLYVDVPKMLKFNPKTKFHGFGLKDYS